MAYHWLLRGWLMNAAKEQVREAAEEAVRDQAEKRRRAEETPDERLLTAPCDVGLVFALKQEVGGLEDRMQDVTRTSAAGLAVRQGTLQDRHVVAVQAGVGRAASARATEALITGHHPQWVISAGFSGALQADIKRHELILADAVAGPDGDELTFDLKAAFPGVRVGRVLTVDEIVRTPEEKEALGRSSQALAVDMESYAVAEVCRREKVRCLIVRIVSDELGDELPKELKRLAKQKTAPSRWGAAVGAVFRRPSYLKDLYRLKEDALIAGDRLAEFLEEIVVRLVEK